MFCNYDSKYSDLELSASGAFRVDSLDTTMISVPAPTLRFIATSGLECSSPYQLQGRDFELVQKFQHRTVFTISNPQNIDVYLKELVKIACSVWSASDTQMLTDNQLVSPSYARNYNYDSYARPAPRFNHYFTLCHRKLPLVSGPLPV